MGRGVQGVRKPVILIFGMEEGKEHNHGLRHFEWEHGLGPVIMSWVTTQLSHSDVFLLRPEKTEYDRAVCTFLTEERAWMEGPCVYCKLCNKMCPRSGPQYFVADEDNVQS